MNAAPADENVTVCHVCGHHNLIGAMVCENCGAMLVDEVNSRTGTRNLYDVLPEFKENPVFAATSSEFKDGMRLRIKIEGQDEAIEIDPSRREMLLGRRDRSSRRRPEVDLEDHEGYRLGVSRKHAILAVRGDELVVQDYGSANGTFLNGVRLPAHRSHSVHDGDVIRLGRLTMRVFFIS